MQRDMSVHNTDKQLDELWRMAYAKTEGVTTSKLLKIKNNFLLLPEPKYVQTVDILGNIENGSEEFYEHYQYLAPTREKQEQYLKQLNTRLCQHCLIPCDFYNNNDSNSDLNSDPNYEQYIALLELTKKQELKWFSDNNKGIMLERAHDTNAKYDLRYSGKDVIKLESHSCTCIDLKIALEILATTIVQLAFRSSLAKKKINIRKEIIATRYVENIIVMLQNDSEKTYIIELNKKIAQAIFLPLIRVAQLVSVGKKKKLGITAKRIQGFGSTGRVDVPVNITEEEIINQGEIISTGQAISIPPYGQYMIRIK
ncbi:hypothetical protein G9A89_000767 [Geosiphon pyriformis]|nr:hypothetical protein G9A89_000767 [Geosiphon pyriformis]